MSGKAATPRAPGTIADVYEPLPEVQSRPAELEPAALDPASNEELWTASRIYSRVDRGDSEALRLTRGFEPILEALNSQLPESEQFVDPGLWLNQGGNLESIAALMLRRPSRRESLDPRSWFRERVTVKQQMERIFGEIRTRRAKDPAFLPGVPDTWTDYYAQLIERDKRERAAASAVLARSPGGVAATATSFAGGALEIMSDPLNIATLPLGGGIGSTKSLALIAAREALLNGAIEAASIPQTAANRAKLGDELTAGEAAFNVGVAAVFGGTLPVATSGAARVAGAGYDWTVGRVFAAMPESVQTKWAARMKVGDMPIGEFYAGLSHREAAEFARDMIGERLTPDELAAAAVVEREGEVAEGSPFVAGPAGDTEHGGRLAVALRELIDNSRAPVEPGAGGGAAGGGAGGAVAPPPAASSTAGGGQSFVTRVIERGAAAIARFKAKVRRAESGGNDSARPRNRDGSLRSSALGRYQFTEDTFADYYVRRFGGTRANALRHQGDAAIQEQLMDDLTADNAALLERGRQDVTPGNLYLVHFLGPRAIKVLQADPAAPVSRLLPAEFITANPEVLAGKSASEVIAWAHRKMGGEASSIPLRPGVATGGAAAEDPRVAQLREEALRLSEQAIGERPLPGGGSVPPMTTGRFRPGELTVDAERFQFKSGGDGFGVTDRLRGVTEWNPIYAGRSVIWEAADGTRFIADGHQRRGLAERIETETGAEIWLDGTVLREVDGVSAEDARLWAALKNIAEGTGTAVDAAKVVRQAGADVLAHLPPKSALVRDGAALARLSDEAFGVVYNDVIPADIAAVVGHLAPDTPEAHAGLVKLLVDLDPANRGQAESIVRQAIAAGFHKSEQIDLFGSGSTIAPLFLERAKVLERGLGELRKLKGAFGVAARNADALEGAGSKIARARAEQEAQRNAEAIEIIARVAFTKGPVSDLLNDAAARLGAGAKLGDVVGEFVAGVRKLELGELGRIRADDSGRLAPDGAGRGGDAGTAGDDVSPQPDGEGQPSLLELEQATARWSDPDAAAPVQAESLLHDFKTALEPRNLAVDGQGRPLRLFRGEHGEGHGGALQSRLGSISFTADREVADLYARSPNDLTKDLVALEPRVIEAELDIRRPVVNDPDDPFIDLVAIERALGREEAIAAADEFADAIMNTSRWLEDVDPEGQFASVGDFLAKHPERLDELYFDAFQIFDSPEWVAKFKAAGYDGAIHGGNGESALTGEFKVFDAGQVRRVDAGADAPAPALDRGAAIDPNIASRNATAIALATQGSGGKRATVEQDGEIGLELFDAADAPEFALGELTFRLSDDGPEISGKDLLDELAADDAAIATIRGCL